MLNCVESVVERSDMRVKAWTQAVKMRDGFECRKCHQKKNLQAHHCIPFNVCPDLGYDINNGVTLCKSCHSEFHTKYGYTRCSHVHVSEFLEKSTQPTLSTDFKAKNGTEPNQTDAIADNPAPAQQSITIPSDIFELLSPLHKRAALFFEKRGELRIERKRVL